MFKHHLLLIYRNFKKYKSSFIINLIGLGAGLSCVLLIYLWVNDEMQMDRFHTKDIYQVMKNEHITDGINTGEETPLILAEAMAKELPEVELAVTVSPAYWLRHSKVSVNKNPAITAAGRLAGPDFFKVFSYPLAAGSADNVLKEKNTVAVSETLAKKLFGTTDVIGKEFTWRNAEFKLDNHALISGVFKDTPANSSDQFDFLISLDALFTASPNFLKWGSNLPATYVVLKKGVDVTSFNARIKDFLLSKGIKTNTLFARPFADSYLYNRYENGILVGGRIDYVKLFSIIAVFILVIACINFMNLSTAKASRRLKEVGVKKVMGAQRGSLILQYMSESMMLTLIAVFLSLLVVELLLPQFNGLVGKELRLQYTGTLLVSLLAITVFTGLVSGCYPALYLSGLKPVTALKGKLNLTSGALWTRQGLVVFQFTLSIVLIVAVLVVYKQIEYIQTKSQGYQKDNVLYFETEGKFKQNVDFALGAVRKLPGVVNASAIDRELLGDLSSTDGEFSWEGRDPSETIRFQRAHVNVGLFETLGIEMAAGRTFSSRFGSDSLKIIVNQAGLKAMRLKNPIGKVFRNGNKDFEIIGIAKDFHFESLHQPVKPMFFKYVPERSNRIMVKTEAGKVKEVMDGLQRLNAKHNSGVVLDLKFLDQDFQAQYVAETRVSALSRYFALLAVVISCLGLFGLATFTAERRLKEIGIRKVLGASGFNVILTLSKDFTKPVLISIIIALPLGYLLSKNWLDSFAYRIDLQLWFFIAAGLLALLISFVTVFYQAFRASRISPVVAIKAE